MTSSTIKGSGGTGGSGQPGRSPKRPNPSPSAQPSQRGRLSAFLAGHSWLRVTGLLSLPLLWLIVAYLGSMAVLLFTSLWSVNSLTGQPVAVYTLGNYADLFATPLFWTVTLRTVLVALGVTIIDAVLAVPLALFMAKVASPAMQLGLVVAVTTPLWASYLVKAYAWRGLLAPNGPFDFITGGNSPGYGLAATVVVLAYLWLPYMVIPVFGAFEKVPNSLFEASNDLGARNMTTLRRVVMPMVFPGIAAGSIFTFSLTMGDYIAVTIVGGKTQLLGNLIYGQLVTANNQPLAAALSMIPLVVIILYLLALRRTGSLENI